MSCILHPLYSNSFSQIPFKGNEHSTLSSERELRMSECRKAWGGIKKQILPVLK